ncbi:hypothetical protein HNP81_002859 [Peribacillus huizhouensis]|uniref:Uncharacterized protein n=1 Tax=Peribacillus huizhouensis TaxID=1501239 RepID=A0ABR6CRA8_9BACI|nr:hypothetical protein [Peribacillus huizhouensis]
MKPSKQSARTTGNQTPFLRKLNRYLHDPIRNETGIAPNNVRIGGVKVVRLG